MSGASAEVLLQAADRMSQVEHMWCQVSVADLCHGCRVRTATAGLLRALAGARSTPNGSLLLPIQVHVAALVLSEEIVIGGVTE